MTWARSFCSRFWLRTACEWSKFPKEHEIEFIMKTKLQIVVAGVLCVSVVSVHAQFGPGVGRDAASRGPKMGASTVRLFGGNSAFSATLEMQSKPASSESIVSVPGKLAF